VAPSRPHVKGRTSGKAFIVSNNIHRRKLNSGQRAMAMAMMYPEPDKHGGVRQPGSSSVTELDISKGRLSMARTVLRADPVANRQGNLTISFATKESAKRHSGGKSSWYRED
jgi:hypothetical protein